MFTAFEGSKSRFATPGCLSGKVHHPCFASTEFLARFTHREPSSVIKHGASWFFLQRYPRQIIHDTHDTSVIRSDLRFKTNPHSHEKRSDITWYKSLFSSMMLPFKCPFKSGFPAIHEGIWSVSNTSSAQTWAHQILGDQSLSPILVGSSQEYSGTLRVLNGKL